MCFSRFGYQTEPILVMIDMSLEVSGQSTAQLKEFIYVYEKRRLHFHFVLHATIILNITTFHVYKCHWMLAKGSRIVLFNIYLYLA